MDDALFSPLAQVEPVHVDVAVIGGGLAGLAAGASAARAGSRVVVFEASTRAGGRARTDPRDGVLLNRGPHALYERGPGMWVLRDLGIDPAGARPSTTGRAVWHGIDGRLPTGAWSVATSRLLSPGSRVAFARFVARLERFDTRAVDTISIADFLDDELGTRRSDARAVVDGLVRLAVYADAPELYSAGAAIDQLRLAISGVRYLHRGWGSLVTSMSTAARSAGATLVSEAPIERIIEGSDTHEVAWTVVDGRGGRWATSAIVLAGSGPDAVERLAGTAAAGLRDAAGPAVRVGCLDLVVAVPPKVGLALDLDQHLYAAVHAPVADLTTDGRSLMSLARYRRPDEVADPQQDRAAMRAFARRLGVETTLDERYLHDMTVAHGMPLANRGGFDGRPPVDALGRTDLLIAGDWVGPTGLLADASLTSGRDAGRLAARVTQQRRAA